MITHAHLDHFGGLQFLVPQTHARLWVHEWDTKTIAEFPQEAAKGRKQIRRFLVQSGMAPEDVGRLMEMHGSPKLDFPGHKVTDSFVDGARIVGDFEVIHPPGHCPGLSCIRVGDVVMLGDPVLNNVSSHQFPKFFTSGLGLLNYFNSLIKIAAHSDTVRLGRPSHYGDIPDVEGRAMEIMAEHNQRIADIVKDLNQPKNLHQISTDNYQYRRGRELQGYDSLLALEEIGAHLEFMMETLGIVRVTNPAALESGSEEIPLYQKTL